LREILAAVYRFKPVAREDIGLGAVEQVGREEVAGQDRLSRRTQEL
jgi:hypothetical protein